MRISEILNENVIPSQRKDFRRVLENNKEKLQKAWTTMGVVRILNNILPDVSFSMFRRLFNNIRVRARYNASNDSVRAYNYEQIFSPNNIRNNWDEFATTLSGILAHEFIHKEQLHRANFKGLPQPNKPTMSADRVRQLRARADELEAIKYSNPSNQQYRKVTDELTKIYRLLDKGGFFSGRSDKDYLSRHQEVGAYAEEIAHEMVHYYMSEHNVPPFMAKKLALEEIAKGLTLVNPNGVEHKHMRFSSQRLDNYRTLFSNDDKTFKKLLKQVYQYIENM